MAPLTLQPAYPTPQHAAAVDCIVEFFSEQPETDAVLLTGSCARGRAVPDSCLDILVLVPPDILADRGGNLFRCWFELYDTEPVFGDLLSVGLCSQLNLDFTGGEFNAHLFDLTFGPLAFELRVGAAVAYSVPLWEHGSRFRDLQTEWLPYYNGDLRGRRLAMARQNCLKNLDYVAHFAGRELYFQAFTRLGDAFRQFLQALFISRCVYPISYDKWIRDQVAGLLGLPDLYARLPSLFEIDRLESQTVVQRAGLLRTLLDEYVGG